MAIDLRGRTNVLKFVGGIGVGVLAATATPAAGQTDATFTGDELDDRWTTPGNWDTTVYPDNGTPAGATYDVTISNQRQVDLDADITIQNLTLVPGTFGIDIDRDGPTHTHTLTTNGLFTWSDGSLQGGNIDNVNYNHGVLSALGGISLDNASPVSFSRWTIHNAAATTVTGSNLNFSVEAVFDNETTGLIDLQADADFVRFNTSASLINAGTIRKSAGAGTSEINVAITQTATGAIDAQSGTLVIGDGTYAGSLMATGGGALEVASGSPNVSFDATDFTVTGGGGVTIRADADYAGTFTSTGDASGMVTLTGDLNVEAGDTAILAFSDAAPISFWSTTGDGTLINQGAAIWASNTIGGGLTNQGDLEVGGSPAAHILAADQTLTNLTGGEVTHVVGTPIILEDQSAIDNQGVWDIQIDLSLLFDARTGTGQTFTNSGTLKKTDGGGTALIDDVALSSTGTLLSTSGTLEIQSAGHITGQVNADGGTVELAGGDLVLDNVTFDVRNGGQVNVFQFFGGGDTTQLVGTFSSTGDGSGEVTFAGPLNVASGENVTFHLVSEPSTSGAPLVLNGELDGNGNARNTGDMIQRGGGRILMGDGTELGGGFVNDGGSYTIEGGALGNSSGNLGTFINDNGGIVAQTSTLFVHGNSRIVNEADSTWNIIGGAYINQMDTDKTTFLNHGQFTKSGATNTGIGAAFVNHGTVTITEGTLYGSDFTQVDGQLVLAGGEFSADFGGEMDINGGFVRGNGTLDGHVNHNGGTLDPGTDTDTGKIVTTNGFYHQGENAILHIDIAGTTPETEYDVLEVGMAFGYSANLAGTIQVQFDASYAPTLGESFDVLLAGGLVNDLGFDVVATGDLWNLSLEHSIVDLVGNDQALRLTVVPEPASLLLLAFGTTTILTRRHRTTTR